MAKYLLCIEHDRWQIQYVLKNNRLIIEVDLLLDTEYVAHNHAKGEANIAYLRKYTDVYNSPYHINSITGRSLKRCICHSQNHWMIIMRGIADKFAP